MRKRLWRLIVRTLRLSTCGICQHTGWDVGAKGVCYDIDACEERLHG